MNVFTNECFYECHDLMNEWILCMLLSLGWYQLSVEIMLIQVQLSLFFAISKVSIMEQEVALDILKCVFASL